MVSETNHLSLIAVVASRARRSLQTPGITGIFGRESPSENKFSSDQI